MWLDVGKEVLEEFAGAAGMAGPFEAGLSVRARRRSYPCQKPAVRARTLSPLDMAAIRAHTRRRRGGRPRRKT